MRYARLGKTEINVSVVGVGTWQYGGEWAQQFTQDQVDAIIGNAKDLGINLIDTAECYGDHLSERLTGQAIRNLGGSRADWIIATKFGHHFHKPFERDDRFDAASVREQLDASLEALQTDYVDLYQFHSGTDEHFDNDELWSMLNDEVKKGRIRHLGISISSKRGAYQAENAARVGASVLQVVYNRIERKPEDDGTFEAVTEHDLGVLARVPLASGFLSGKYSADSTFDTNDVREVWGGDKRQQVLEEVEKVKGEVPNGVPMAQWALAWCLKHEAVTCVIPGCRNVEQVISNAAAAEME